MITYIQGNLLEAEVEALVNTVNEVGVMGKGIALMFREAFPANMAAYEAACRRKEVRVGRMFVTENHGLTSPHWIINFPTKKHWRHPSRFEWVKEGLSDLRRVIQEKNIRSIALPPLGCGNGGLEWPQVRTEIEQAMAGVPDVEVFVYEPTEKYQNAPKKQGVKRLTPARALVVELIRRYCVLGIECSQVEVQKLAYFLDRSIKVLGLRDPLQLKFIPHRYGPFAPRLTHLLGNLDGSYLRSEKRIFDSKAFDPIYFRDEKVTELLSYLGDLKARPYRPALEMTARIIDGFESPLGMEALSTIDWLIMNGCEPSVPAIKQALLAWSNEPTAGERKLSIFDDQLLEISLERLEGIFAPQR